MNNNIVKILFIGQTPPPIHGQSIMIENLLNFDSGKIVKFFIRMNYSKDLYEIGTFNLSKFFELLRIILLTFKIVIKNNIKIIYYPPSGYCRNAVYRDILTLLPIRLLKPEFVFHFHAMGLERFYNEIRNPMTKFFFRKAYLFPHLCVCLAKENFEEIKFLHAKNNIVIPYGIKDEIGVIIKRHNQITNVLYMGNLIKSKGIMLILDAMDKLEKENIYFKLSVAGGFTDKKFETELKAHKLYFHPRIEWLGVVTGENKKNIFKNADIFCFPTYYESENFSVVLLEAMSYSLPIITTKWRGLASIVDDQDNGFLLPIKDDIELYSKLKILLLDPDRRMKMGERGRQKFLSTFTLEQYHKNFENAFLKINIQE